MSDQEAARQWISTLTLCILSAAAYCGMVLYYCSTHAGVSSTLAGGVLLLLFLLVVMVILTGALMGKLRRLP
ncbi:MAG: hypothetical protein IJ228_07710 [Succinivibrio sp.]|nr:hypothetical protein [Succinivibrio sp.]